MKTKSGGGEEGHGVCVKLGTITAEGDAGKSCPNLTFSACSSPVGADLLLQRLIPLYDPAFAN